MGQTRQHVSVRLGTHGPVGATLLIDVSDKANRTITDQILPHDGIWDARYLNGHVYSGDSGVAVLKIV